MPVSDTPGGALARSSPRSKEVRRRGEGSAWQEVPLSIPRGMGRSLGSHPRLHSHNTVLRLTLRGKGGGQQSPAPVPGPRPVLPDLGTPNGSAGWGQRTLRPLSMWRGWDCTDVPFTSLKKSAKNASAGTLQARTRRGSCGAGGAFSGSQQPRVGRRGSPCRVAGPIRGLEGAAAHSPAPAARPQVSP